MIFGYYTFSAKSYSAQGQEARVNISGFKDVNSFVRVAHLLFIPFFILKVFWGARTADGIVAFTPATSDELTRAYGEPVRPWYAFSGIVLIMVGMIAFVGYDGYSKESRHRTEKNSIAASISGHTKMIDDLAVGDIIVLHPWVTIDFYNARHFRVNAVMDDVLTGEYILVPRPNAYRKVSQLAYELDTARHITAATLNVQELRDNLCRISQSCRKDSISSPGIRLFGVTDSLYLRQIYRPIDGIELASQRVSSYSYNATKTPVSRIRYNFKNNGSDFKVLGIEQVEGEVDWVYGHPGATWISDKEVYFTAIVPGRKISGISRLMIETRSGERSSYLLEISRDSCRVTREP